MTLPPHNKTKRTTRFIMLDAVIALLPACIAGTVFFGWHAALTIFLSVLSAFCFDLIYYLITHKVWKCPAKTFRGYFEAFDFTQIITGLLLALSLPASVKSWYLPVVGSAFAILAVKAAFGGTGKNIVNPAIAGRVFLFVCFTATAFYPAPMAGNAPVTGATQLQSLLAGETTLPLIDLFTGNKVAGCLGETCKPALLLGGVYLAARGVIKWYLPLLLLGAEGLTAVALQGSFSVFLPSLFTGGLMLGAIFMATDYVTAPKSFWGKLVYFPLVGIIIAVTRYFAQTETTSFIILIMNFAVYPIDAAIFARPFGSDKRRKPHEKNPV